MREAWAVVLTGVLHLVFEEVLHQKALFIALAVLGWGSYIVLSARRDPGVLQTWGFRRDNLRAALPAPTIFSLLAFLALAGAGLAQDTLRLNWHMVPLLLLYPIWGLIQQLLIQALFVRNVVREVPALRAPWLIVPLAAFLFGIVHWPDVRLMVATFLLGLAFTPMYLHVRNLWPLGIYHGWLGVFAYFWLLDRDPWIEVFG